MPYVNVGGKMNVLKQNVIESNNKPNNVKIGNVPTQNQKFQVKLNEPKQKKTNVNIVTKKSSKNDKQILKHFGMNKFFAFLNWELEYYAIMFSQILDEYLDNMVQVFDVTNNVKTKTHTNTKTKKTKTKTHTKTKTKTKTKTNTYTTPQTGGGDCQTVTKYLNYGIPDTLHDFGGDRNCVYPNPFSANNFLLEAEKFLDYNNIPKTRDPLKNEYTAVPGDFERVVKINYLLGEYCPVDNIEFYFSKPIESSKTEYKVYNKYVPENISTFYDKYTSGDGYKYYVIDACMSVQKEDKFKNNMIRLKSLCDLWDPVGAGTLQVNELFDHEDNPNNLIKDLGLKLIPEEIAVNNEKYILLDSRLIDSDKRFSLYDAAYNELLNVNCLETQQITFKLRLIERNNSFYVAIVTLDNGKPVNVHILLEGGYSLPDLSIVMAYLEYDGKSFECSLKNSVPKSTQTIPQLMEFVKFIYNLIQNKTKKKSTSTMLLKRMVTRFKSSGDHGSALTAQFINTNCSDAIGKTMYLSGDQLCYIYSILIGNPTLFRYFSPTGLKKSNEECDMDRVHFLGFFSPIADKNVLMKVAVKRNLLFLEEYIKEEIKYTQDVKFSKDKLNIYDKEVDILIRENHDLKKKNVPDVQHITKYLKNTLLTIDVIENATEELLEIVRKIEKILFKIHYLRNMGELEELANTIFVNQLELLQPVANVITVRERPSRGDLGKFTYIHTELIDTIKKYNKSSNFRGSFIQFLHAQNAEIKEYEKDEKNKSSSLLSILKKIKGDVLDKTKQLTLKVKTIGSISGDFLLKNMKPLYNAKFKMVEEKINTLPDNIKDNARKILLEYIFDVDAVKKDIEEEPIDEKPAKKRKFADVVKSVSQKAISSITKLPSRVSKKIKRTINNSGLVKNTRKKKRS